MMEDETQAGRRTLTIVGGLLMNPDILDEDGQPIPKQTGRVKRFWEWLIANWKVVLPIAVSVTALFVAVWSVCVAKRDSEVTRRLSKLDFRPVLRLYTVLNPTGKIVPFWQVTNTGPVEAVQVKVEMISHRYSPSRQKMFFRLKDSTNTTTIPTIAPEETKGYAFQKGWLDSNARVQEPPQCNIMEILLTYRRPQDLEEYSESAYYFIDPNGFWVSERSSSLNGEPYDSMKAALLMVEREGPFSVYDDSRLGDTLHPNE